MESRVTIPPPLWFVCAILPMVASQIVRLQQSDPAAWIFWDYAWRPRALAVLGVIPSARRIAFGREHLRIIPWEIGIWIAGIVLVDHYLCGWIRRTFNSALPSTVLGHYPEPHGWLHYVDIVFGMALVAYSEELMFRRCARVLFQKYVRPWVMVLGTSVLFGAYHWWTGVGNIVEAVLIGALLMLFYQRSVALWPVVLAHYLTDVVDFAL